MPDSSTKNQSSVLMGWKEIAIYLNLGLRTVQRYEQQHQLPVLRPSGKLKGPVLATKSELDLWVDSFSKGLGFESNTLPRSEPSWKTLKSNIIRAQRLRSQTVELGSKLVGSIAGLQKTLAHSQSIVLNVVGSGAIPSNGRRKPRIAST